MTFNVALSVVIYIILATGFNAERQCGDNGGKKILKHTFLGGGNLKDIFDSSNQ